MSLRYQLRSEAGSASSKATFGAALDVAAFRWGRGFAFWGWGWSVPDDEGRCGCGFGCLWGGDAQLLAVVEERLGAGGEENGGEKFGDGEVVLAVGVAAPTALEAGAIGGEKRHAVAGLQDVFGRFDGGANGGWVEWGDGA